MATLHSEIDHCMRHNKEMTDDAAKREKAFQDEKLFNMTNAEKLKQRLDNLQFDLADTKKTVKDLGARFLDPKPK